MQRKLLPTLKTVCYITNQEQTYKLKFKLSVATSHFLEPQLLNEPTPALKGIQAAILIQTAYMSFGTAMNRIAFLWAALNQRRGFTISKDGIEAVCKTCQRCNKNVETNQVPLIPVFSKKKLWKVQAKKWQGWFNMVRTFCEFQNVASLPFF